MASAIGNFYCDGSIHCMDESLGKRVKRLRLAAGFKTQGELADAMGVDQSKVSDIERDMGMGAEILMRLADALDCSAELVMRGTDTRTWPFDLIDIGRFNALSETKRGFAQARLLQAIEEVEKEPKPPGAAVERLKVKPPATPQKGARKLRIDRK